LKGFFQLKYAILSFGKSPNNYFSGFQKGDIFLNTDNTELKRSSKLQFFCCQTASLGSGGLIIQFIIFAYVILRKLMALRFFLVFGFNWLWWNWADNGRKVFILTSVKVLLLRCTVCSVKVVPIDSNEALVINAH